MRKAKRIKTTSIIRDKTKALEQGLITHKDLETKKIKKKTGNPNIKRDSLGRYIKGETGNPLGISSSYANKVKQFREDLLNLFTDTKSKEKLLQALLEGKTGANKDIWLLIDKIVSTLPKQQEVSGIEPHKNIVINVNKAKTPADDDKPVGKMTSRLGEGV